MFVKPPQRGLSHFFRMGGKAKFFRELLTLVFLEFLGHLFGRAPLFEVEDMGHFCQVTKDGLNVRMCADLCQFSKFVQ